MTGAIAWLLTTSAGSAATYYVSPSGSSSNNGSQAAPWRQIRDALPRVVAGDTILVADGSYLGFDMDGINGTAAAPITIKATGLNAVVTKTTDRPDNRDTIYIAFSSYIVIDGLTSFTATRAAVRVDQSPHITVRNGVFGNNTTWGIFTDFADYLLLEANECYGSVQQHGIYVSNTCVNPTVRKNRTHDNNQCGIQLNGDVSQGGSGIITGALIEKNIIYNNGGGGGSAINLDGVRSSTVRNNLLYNNHATGIALFQIDGATGPSGIDLYHNTIDMASNARWAVLIYFSDAGAGPIRLRNNILINRNTSHGGIVYGDTTDVNNTNSDYNIMDKVSPDDETTIYTLAQWQSQGKELHSRSATIASLFVNPAAGDYHLLATAPALGTGQPVATVVDDLDGMPRPPYGPTDIGCYQKIRKIGGNRSMSNDGGPEDGSDVP